MPPRSPSPTARSAPRPATTTPCNGGCRSGVADLPARIGEVWSELGLADDLLDQPTASLSGGEAARVGLAALLLSRFDVYLLDEPTNDLDLDGLDRLERWIEGSSSASRVVLVSHDRTFLARTVTTVVELDEFTHRATTFRGWLAGLSRREGGRRASCLGAVRGVRRQALGTRRAGPSASVSGRPRVTSSARTSDERDKFIRHHQINQTEQLAGRAARTERAMERLAVVDKPRVPWQLRLDIATAEPQRRHRRPPQRRHRSRPAPSASARSTC